MKVLIIDPDWRFAQQARTFLESHAHLVVHHTRADSGLDHADHWQPDLVILATELAERGALAALQRGEERPAILLAGWLDRYDIAWRAWQQGGDELLMKPIFSVEELHAAVVTARETAAAGGRAERPARAASA